MHILSVLCFQPLPSCQILHKCQDHFLKTQIWPFLSIDPGPSMALCCLQDEVVSLWSDIQNSLHWFLFTFPVPSLSIVPTLRALELLRVQQKHTFSFLSMLLHMLFPQPGTLVPTLSLGPLLIPQASFNSHVYSARKPFLIF